MYMYKHAETEGAEGRGGAVLFFLTRKWKCTLYMSSPPQLNQTVLYISISCRAAGGRPAWRRCGELSDQIRNPQSQIFCGIGIARHSIALRLQAS